MAEATEAYHGHAREEAVAAFAKSWCGYKRWSNWMLRPSVQPSCCRAARNDSDAPHPLALLRARRERPRGCRAAEQRDEVAALHSITSSASASNLSGISTPSALAVLTLITSWNLVGSTTGRSPGFSPLRMRPA